MNEENFNSKKHKHILNHLNFNDIVDLNKDKVVNTCYGFVHQKEDAEDIAQEVFIAIYQSFSEFKNESNLSTWIYRIAVNKSLDFIKAKNRKKRLKNIQSIFNSNDEIIPIQDETTLDGEKRMHSIDQRKALNAALEKLPKNQRIAITLNKFENLKAKEIADIMDINQSSVESLIHRAKGNLKNILYHFYEKNYK